MAGFATRIDFEGSGLSRPLAALRNMRALGGNIRPFMEDAKKILLESTIERFRTGRGPDGIPWAQTKRQVRQAVGPAGPNKARILYDTGDLLASIRADTGPDYVEVGSDGLKNPVKALANQFGSHRQTVVVRHERTVTRAFGAPLRRPVTSTVRGHGRITNLPARPFIGIDKADEAHIESAWERRLIATFAEDRSNG